MNAFDIINDIATFLIISIFMLRFKKHQKNIHLFNPLVLIYTTFLMSKIIIKYINYDC